MYDMEPAMQGGESESESCHKEATTGRVEEEVFKLRPRSQTKAQIAVESYCRLRSIPAAAIECQMSESQVRSYVSAARNKRGLKDSRLLYAKSEDEFNCGDNTDDAVRQSDLMAMVEQQQYRCALSGIELTPQTAALDHIVPVSRGGEHAVRNLQWLNSEVNRMKGMLSVEVFVDICMRVARHADGSHAAQGHPQV